MARPKGYKFQFKLDRITKFTPDTLQKLEESAAYRLDIKASCAYANISRETYYRWIKEIKGLSDRLDDLRETPIMKAKRTIINGLNEVGTAFRYLEKEKPEDYAERLKIEHIGDELHEEDEVIRLEYKQRLLENIKNRALAKAKKNEDS